MQKQSVFRRLRSSRVADTTEWNHMKNISPQVHGGVAARHPADPATFQRSSGSGAAEPPQRAVVGVSQGQEGNVCMQQKY